MATANVHTVYRTPESWGNVTEYADIDGMTDIIKGLREVGFTDCTLSECKRFDLGIADNETAHISRDGEVVRIRTAYITANGNRVYTEK